MKPVSIRNNSYKDNLAKKRRSKFLLLSVSISIVVISLLAGLVYFLLFSGYFSVRDIQVTGLKTLDKELVISDIDNLLNGKILKTIQLRANIFLASPKKIRDILLDKYSVLKEVSARRNGLNGLILEVYERTAIGTWCFSTECVYFDETGATWGKAARSSGFLILNVDDRRESINSLDKEYFIAIKSVTENISIISVSLKQVVIPAESFREFGAETSGGYDILFSTDSDIKAQLELLKIFLDNKSHDQSFKPSYIDLRINGRIYFKNQ
jgi:cell division septal protein FtsQ